MNKKVKKANKENIDKSKINKKPLKQKYMILLVGISFICLFLIVARMSYAFFTTTVKGKEFIVYTGNLAVNYEKKTDVINLSNLYPMTNEEGLKQISHSFNVNNSGNIEARYQVRLEVDELNKLPLEYVKLSYSVDNKEYSTPVLLSNLNSSLVFLKNMILSPSSSNTISIKLWIDLNAPNEIQGKEFKARVVVDSIQNVDDGYNIDTAPIIKLNKDKNGNYDINLKKGEAYTELGVEKIEDDNDIFTPSQVAISYEYYDGNNIINVDKVDTNKIGIYYITYSITDSSNNTGKSIRIVTVNNTDTIPKITLNGDATITLGAGDYYKENGVVVENNNKVVILSDLNTNLVCKYTIKYIVIDSNNNLNSVIRTVVINSKYKEVILNGTDPILASNLLPVTISDSGVVTKASTASSWYNYENKVWANSIILKDESISYQNGEIIPEDNIESYFVWIPRYSYQLFDLGDYTSSTTVDSKPSESAAQEIQIKFGTNNTKDEIDGECTTPMLSGDSGNCKVGDYMTHPAFISMDTIGLWVAKFETTGTTNAISTLPNQTSLRNINVKTMFELSYNYNRSLDSHMMKNTEWGAVAYLSHSKYGINSEIRINNSNTLTTGCSATTSALNYVGNYQTDHTEGYYHGCENAYNTSIGYLASTTGNISGIYDMSGGAWEYMASYSKNNYSNSGFDAGSIAIYDNKYFDIYPDDSTVMSYNNRILGDATGELGPFYFYLDSDGYERFHSTWYSDGAFFLENINSWTGRGGDRYLGVTSGTFQFERRTGGAEDYISFRIVLAP